MIILGPGSFLTSIMPPLLLREIAEAIRGSRAIVVFISNLVDEEVRLASCHCPVSIVGWKSG